MSAGSLLTSRLRLPLCSAPRAATVLVLRCVSLLVFPGFPRVIVRTYGCVVLVVVVVERSMFD